MIDETRLLIEKGGFCSSLFVGRFDVTAVPQLLRLVDWSLEHLFSMDESLGVSFMSKMLEKVLKNLSGGAPLFKHKHLSYDCNFNLASTQVEVI